MRVVALISGGKDSCYNMVQCVAAGHEIVALANLQPENKGMFFNTILLHNLYFSVFCQTELIEFTLNFIIVYVKHIHPIFYCKQMN